MKRSKLCFGLLSVLSIIFGLSFVKSSDVSALKYSIDNFSIMPGDIYTFRKLNNEFVYFIYNKSFTTSLVSVPDGFTFPHIWYFNGLYDFETNTCALPLYDSSLYSDGVHRYDSYDGTTDFTSIVPGSDKFDFSIMSSLTSPINWSSLFVINPGDFLYRDQDNPLCNIYGYAYNDMSDNNPANFYYAPRWDFSSLINIPLVNNRIAYENSKPFFYSYDGIMINGSKYEDGVYSTKHGITTAELFKANSASSIRQISFSLPLFQKANNSIDDESEYAETVYNFDITGSLEFDKAYTVNSDFSIHLYIRDYYNPNFTSSPDLPNIISINNHSIYRLGPYDEFFDKVCTFTEYHSDNGDDSNRIDFVCSYNPSIDGGFSPEINFRFLDTRIGFMHDAYNNSSSDGVSMFTTDGDFKFVDFNIVTNNNTNPAAFSSTGAIDGGDTTISPGNEGQASLYNPDFTSSLSNLFNFSLVNPFATLFSLFTDGTSCANIPTIAGMLGSTETTYCPWFDSTTRSVLTPVLGLSATMLLFGFFVRWLGASSGNFFEDSGSHETKNFKIKQKGGK